MADQNPPQDQGNMGMNMGGGIQQPMGQQGQGQGAPMPPPPPMMPPQQMQQQYYPAQPAYQPAPQGQMPQYDYDQGMMPPSAGGGSSGPPMPPGAYQQDQDMSGYPPAPPGPPKPPSPPANFRLGGLLPPVLKIKVPPHELKFDEQYFLHLLAGSISLTKDEKSRIVDSIPKLKQTQIDELIRIFEEERQKFAELGQEHVPQLDKLAQQHYQDWMDIEIGQQQSAKADEDAKKAAELRKQLGL